jgi:hypothetical protein
MQFPSEWPPNCPPQEAKPTNGDYFHLACESPLSFKGGSFKTAEENDRFLNGCPCERKSLSVFPTVDDVLDFLDKLPPALKRHWTHIAKAPLTPSEGRVQTTPSKKSQKHMSWWTNLDPNGRLALFTIETSI